MKIYCDFDGTITTEDTTDVVLRELALPGWETLEQDWIAGRISAAQCMRQQIELVQGDDAALERVVSRIELRHGFKAFVRWCEDENLPLIIVSDGVDRLIRLVLKRYGLLRLPVIANRLGGEPGQRRLEQPWATSACAGGAGVCKCRVTQAGGRDWLVYVGDGRSDFCVAEEADLLFARSELARHCVSRGLPFIGFDSFSDVQRYLFLIRLDQRGAEQSVAPLRAGEAI